tara:strand:+ start:1581 stop:2003 length:423 start_codon:yes stop_codon:yes gene_type:complete
MFNQVNLIGRMGKDPEIKTTKAGDKFAKFSLATNSYHKDKVTGEMVEETQWHNVTVWDPRLADKVDNKAAKGTKIHLTGTIKYRKYKDQTGAERTGVDIEVPRYSGIVNIVDNKSGNGIAHPQAQPQPEISKDINDDIPF